MLYPPHSFELKFPKILFILVKSSFNSDIFSLNPNIFSDFKKGSRYQDQSIFDKVLANYYVDEKLTYFTESWQMITSVVNPMNVLRL